MDLEARAHSEHPESLRLWLRLLTCTQLIEKQVRGQLRTQFDTTLPRFDLMAQLEKSPEGLTLSDVSRRMMVSNGNVTGLVERLVAQKLLKRYAHPTDRRTTYISLTEAGRKSFAEMAREHRAWISDLFGDLGPQDIEKLMALLAKTKKSVQRGIRKSKK